MWLRSVVVALWVVAGLVPDAQAETLQEVIDKNIEARGGLEALTAVQATRIVGTLQLDDVKGPYTIEWKAPDMFRIDFTLRDVTNTQAYDGKEAWIINPFSSNPGATRAKGDQFDKIRANSDYLVGELVNAEEKGHRLEWMGKTTIEDREAFKIRVTRADGDVVYNYLDTEHYLVFRRDSKRKIHDKLVDMTTHYEDYKRVDGLLIAHTKRVAIHAESMNAHGANQLMTIRSIDLDPLIKDSRFAMPGGSSGS